MLGSQTERFQLGQAKIQHFDPAILRHEDVVRLEIAMDDACGMGRRQSLRKLEGILQRFTLRQPTAVQFLPQGFPFQQLRDEIGLVLVLADIKDDQNIGMVQGGQRLGFLLEPAQTVGALGKVLGQNLQSYVTTEASVPRSPDLTHCACPQGGGDLVMADGSANHYFALSHATVP